MTTKPAKFILILCAAFLASVGMLHAAAEARQPRMEKAIDLLQEAKISAVPLQYLQSAKTVLEHAAHNKGGFRIVALEIVDRAIDAARSGDNPKMIVKINAAIANIHSGMAHAPGPR